jgi:release factor glutamine methyltransferase
MANTAITAQDARRLLCHILGLSAETYQAGAPFTLTVQQQQVYDALMRRRLEGEPVAKIIGKKDFWKHTFLTNRHTLDPRPESEHLIEAVLAYRPDTSHTYHILDCGTGSGCLLLSLLHEYGHAQGLGIDISPHAITTAQANATRLSLMDRASWQVTSWRDLTTPPYDIVISNPPYIPTLDISALMSDVKEYDPLIALDGGEDGLDAYRELFAHLSTLLKRGGLFVCEIGASQEVDVVTIGKAAQMSYRETIRDLAGLPRVLVWERLAPDEDNSLTLRREQSS